MKNSTGQEISTNIVIVIDIDNNTYYNHFIFGTLDEAGAFADGMMEAWKISHGHFNCWKPYILSHSYDFQEWKEMKFPGKEKIESYLEPIMRAIVFEAV